LWMTDVELDAVADEQIMSLGDVFNIRVGSRLMLGAGPSSLIQLKCGDIPMHLGRMGRKGDHIAIRIEDRIEKPTRS
ncbi:MAG: FliM/FliN family flagellar motor switch protein, partial [Rhodospirillales bacterium]|nr:FliM/FliN family flagellar motor switch protein [Rhodospirillales bacterium]